MNKLLILIIIFYLLAFVFAKKKNWSMILFLAGSLVNFSAVFWNWYVIGEPPFGNLYHVMLLLGACFFPVYLAVVIFNKMDWLARYFPITAALPVFFALVLWKGELWHQPPVLQSPWFIPHVVSYMVSYSLAAIAFVLLVSGLLRKSEIEKHEDMSYRLLAVAFPLMTFGLVSGAIWADSAWSSYWSRDPKETWALITWLLYAVYFHFMNFQKIRKYAGIVQILAFVSLLVTFLLVNLIPKLSSPLHSYL